MATSSSDRWKQKPGPDRRGNRWRQASAEPIRPRDTRPIPQTGSRAETRVNGRSSSLRKAKRRQEAPPSGWQAKALPPGPSAQLGHAGSAGSSGCTSGGRFAGERTWVGAYTGWNVHSAGTIRWMKPAVCTTTDWPWLWRESVRGADGSPGLGVNHAPETEKAVKPQIRRLTIAIRLALGRTPSLLLLLSAPQRYWSDIGVCLWMVWH